jgi:F-type H+-transporting ATPase subunit epsilon
MKLKLTVVTPERTVLEQDADSVQIPGELGYLGILPGHAPLITTLKTGVLSYRDGAAEGALAISAGFAQVVNDAVRVLADSAEAPAEIDADAAERERVSAQEALKSAGRDTLPQIREQLEIAQARLQVVGRRA